MPVKYIAGVLCLNWKILLNWDRKEETTETYIADDNATLISKNFRDLKKYLDMVSHGQISIPYLTRFKKVIINKTVWPGIYGAVLCSR